MKTSELKRILREDYVEVFSEHERTIYGVGFTVWKTEQKLVVRGIIPLGVIKVLGEYTNTPLNEREDEKKYRIELAEIRESVLTKDGIRATIYTLSSMITSSNETKVILNNIFTQSEIDNFPKEIKRAIECGFLRKVEVE